MILVPRYKAFQGQGAPCPARWFSACPLLSGSANHDPSRYDGDGTDNLAVGDMVAVDRRELQQRGSKSSRRG